MSPETSRIFFAVFAVWGLAILWKASVALHKDAPYKFSLWDGGLLREGKQLNRIGTWVKLFTAIAIIGWCATSLAGLFVTGSAFYILCGLILASVVSDFVNATN